VEKLLYVLWKAEGLSAAEFREHLLGQTAERMLAGGALVLAVAVADKASEFASHLRITRLAEPMTGMVSVWLQSASHRAPIEAALGAVTSGLAGYLVAESVPLARDLPDVPPRMRLPGLYTVAFVERPERLSWEQWRSLWQEEHTQVAIETQSTFLYVQNAVVRSLTPDAPPWAAIVEQAFPAAAASDPAVFFDARGSPQKLEENRRRMLESCARFLDLDRVESHPMSCYVLRDPAWRKGDGQSLGPAPMPDSAQREIEAIKRLKYRYARCLDMKLWDEMRSCFTEDAACAYDGGKYSFSGRERILDFLRSALGPNTRISCHHVHHPEIDLTGPSRAVGTWALEDLVIDTAANLVIRGAAYYRDEYAKIDGDWRIRFTGYERTFEEVLSRADIPSLRLTANRWAPVRDS